MSKNSKISKKIKGFKKIKEFQKIQKFLKFQKQNFQKFLIHPKPKASIGAQGLKPFSLVESVYVSQDFKWTKIKSTVFIGCS